jgi:hypothetical protein
MVGVLTSFFKLYNELLKFYLLFLLDEKGKCVFLSSYLRTWIWIYQQFLCTLFFLRT